MTGDGGYSDLSITAGYQIRARDQNIYFTWTGYVVAVYTGKAGTAEDLWRVIQSAQG